jgi:hypothetical protein
VPGKANVALTRWFLNKAEPQGRVRVVAEEDTSKDSPAPGEPKPIFITKIEEEREAKRGQIALLLCRLLVGIAIGALLLIAARKWLGLTIAELKDILTVLLPPVIALVGTVSGFYFGGRAERP